ncbi:hypothetical protein ACIPSE_32090 [Streptomyces sp. NPDC090106]|uniref:hypothetical protein n=1 Tax=Streptomyces sp. NPDC090106 TaxID=3365946 RepID=UPI00381670F1
MGLRVLAEMMMDAPEAAPGVRLPVGFADLLAPGEGSPAVVRRRPRVGVEPDVVPADAVEGDGLPERMARGRVARQRQMGLPECVPVLTTVRRRSAEVFVDTGPAGGGRRSRVPMSGRRLLFPTPKRWDQQAFRTAGATLPGRLTDRRRRLRRG